MSIIEVIDNEESPNTKAFQPNESLRTNKPTNIEMEQPVQTFSQDKYQPHRDFQGSKKPKPVAHTREDRKEYSRSKQQPKLVEPQLQQLKQQRDRHKSLKQKEEEYQAIVQKFQKLQRKYEFHQ